jgi:hypothetical protein
MSAENNGAHGFNVHIKDMAGHSITIEKCTPETLISSLIEQFREGASRNNGAGIPKISKIQHIILTNDMGQLNEATLGDNNIRGVTNLFAVYDSIPSCIPSEPIAEHLHRWIEEEKITFDEPINDIIGGFRFHKAIDGINFLEEYNNFHKGANYLFFLTNTTYKTFANPYTFISNRLINRSIIYYSGMPNNTLRLRRPIIPDMEIIIGSDTELFSEIIPVKNNFSVRGIFERLDIRIIQKTQGDLNIEREFQIYVVLKAPFTIYKPDGTVVPAPYENDKTCHVPYDFITMCDENGQPRIPNNSNLAGGRRSKRSKRSQKKRKTRRTRRK